MPIDRAPETRLTIQTTSIYYLTSCLLLFICLLLSTPPLHAAANEVEQHSQGFGDTYQEALSSALLNSVQQVRGLETGTAKGIRFDLKAISSADSFLHLNGKIGQTSDTYSQSQGWIKSYTVTEVKKPKNEDDTWQVNITAMIPIYQQTGADDKRDTIAVIPFRVTDAIIAVDGSPHASSQISKRLANAIQSTLVRSQHYAVLNRHFENEVNREQRLWASNAVNPMEASRLGEQLGADFILLGQLHRFTLGYKEKAFYGADFGRHQTEIELSYQLIESATGKIIWTDQKHWFKTIHKNETLLAGVLNNLGNEIAIEMLKATAPASALKKVKHAIVTPEKLAAPIIERPLTPGSNGKPVKW